MSNFWENIVRKKIKGEIVKVKFWEIDKSLDIQYFDPCKFEPSRY